MLHGALVAGLLWAGADRLRHPGRGPGPAGGGGGAPPAVNFFVLPPSAPAAADLAAAPQAPITSFSTLSKIKIELPRLDVGKDSGSGGASGQGASPGQGAGSAEGSGTGGEGDYIVIASPRTLILPPLAKVPGSVAGRTYRIRFWVEADGRVTRVEVDPPIADEAYRREFLKRMLAYQFVPAQTRDGRNVASVYTVTLQPGH